MGDKIKICFVYFQYPEDLYFEFPDALLVSIQFNLIQFNTLHFKQGKMPQQAGFQTCVQCFAKKYCHKTEWSCMFLLTMLTEALVRFLSLCLVMLTSAWDLAPRWKKKRRKIGVREKKNPRAGSEPRGSLSPIPGRPLGSLPSPIFFLFDPVFFFLLFSLTAEPGPRLC